uniref:Uncharacterized protein n=1 Tax=viral metagenome TaxID=1070528 RepID=A0A6C0D6V0_9ZZZZ
MEELIYHIQSLEGYMPKYVTYISNYKDKNKFKEAFIRHKMNKVLTLANDLLINNKGGCNWDNIETLEDAGYHIGPGEQDRFGWVTGIIGTSKGDIVFG